MIKTPNLQETFLTVLFVIVDLVKFMEPGVTGKTLSLKKENLIEYYQAVTITLRQGLDILFICFLRWWKAERKGSGH